MSKLSIQVEKQVVMALTSIILLGSGCEDRMDSRRNISVGEGTPVDVTFRIGLADEADAYTLSGAPVTKASESTDGTQAFNYALCPASGTKATASLKPDALYNLEIRQYNTAGTTCLNSSTNFSASSNAATGSLISTTLQTATHCQLVLVAWGKDNTTRLGTEALSEAQKVSVSNSYMDAIDPSKQEDMNKMPYVLHLTDVNVASDGSLYSADGEAIDIRLLLKRLAIRLNVDWAYNASVPGANYQLGQILLQSVPLDYKVVATPDPKLNNTYPSLLDQFTTKQLTAAEILAGSYSCWLPANVRGTNPAATSLLYRIKSNAPTGSTYIDFQAINRNNTKQKLSYRVYLGSNDNNDFNLYGNRNYSYTVNFNHTALPTNDLRVSIIDPIPASQGNSNLVPTANCFMIAPGGAFCFNPYTYSINGSNDNANTVLRGWCSANKIGSVKVLWQTKENGDVGDPVLGVVSSAIDHTNIVDLTEGDSFKNARIYCRVAPNTTGGSGLIVAYDDEDGTGNIIWSWHVWVTDYNPDARGNIDVQIPENKRKQKYVGNNAADQFPMMDRNLGAMAGYAVVPDSPIEQSKTNGFHYQQGRKDPFPSSYSAETKSTVPDIYSSTPPKDMLNLYGPDGLTYKQRERGSISNIRDAYKNPIKMYTSSALSDAQGKEWAGNTKTIHDPCPAGWRIAAKENYQALFEGTYYVGSTVHKYTPRLASGFNWDDGKKSGGYLIVYNDNSCTTYFRMTGFGNNSNSFVIVGEAGNIWTCDYKVAFDFGFNANATKRPAYEVSYGWQSADAHATRCIQERE